MGTLFSFLFLTSLIVFLIAMVKPSLFSKLHIRNRKYAALIFGGMAIYSFILVGITAPTPVQHEQSVEGVMTSVTATSAPSPIVKQTSKPTSSLLLAPTHTPTPTLTLAPTHTPTSTIQPTVTAYIPIQNTSTPEPTASSTTLNNDNYYTNSDGNQVHSPADSTNGQVPAGATAQCNDGTYSFSQHHQGTCSGHGGVAQWL